MTRYAILLLVFVLILGGYVSAQERHRGSRGAETESLTEEQRDTLADIWSRMAELRTEMTQTLQEYGLMSEEAGEWMRRRSAPLTEDDKREGRPGFWRHGCFSQTETAQPSRRGFRR